ncbi:hypothetical protein [Croceivirga thetidis]|uniref:Secreted protein n=1 Tax=Croceivirga thetidis TaxID=2721623 RepID=A0ABX1GPL3_9FLAO|nr:hypothetical protein [Croceivirga thetidis]NKI31858.1 hypothetical protein [Croceivirga thetidis]
MKKSLVLLLALCTSSLFYAQVSGVRTELPTEMVRNFQMGNNILPTNLVGTPFLDETFSPGIAQVKDKKYNAVLRYNAYADEIEMKDENNESIALLKRDYITASFGGNDYQILTMGDKKGYVITLEEGAYSLYKRHQKEFIPEKEATSSYGSNKPPQLVDDITYYIKMGDEAATEIKLKKSDLAKFLGEKKVKEYAKMNKSKLNSEQDVIALLKTLNAGVQS